MKKLFALILLSVMLLSSCAEIGNSGNGGDTTVAPETTRPETTGQIDILKVDVDFKKADFYIFSCDIPLPLEDPRLPKLPEDLFDYVFELSDVSANGNSYSDGALSFEFPLTEYKEYKKFDGTMSSTQTDCSKAGIIDSKEKLSEAIEKGTKKKYSELYTDDFFEKNIIIYISKYHSGSVFYEFEYGFDPETKLLAIHFTQPVKDMFKHSEMHHTYDYYITIPKEVITVDGKIIPYEELNFRFTGYDDK